EGGWALRLWLPDRDGRMTSREIPELGEALSELALLDGSGPADDAAPPPSGALEGTVLLVLGEAGAATVDALLSWATHPGAVHLPGVSAGTVAGRFERAGWAVREI